MRKIKIRFAGFNSNGNKCYVSETGYYFALIDNEFYYLNQSPEYGFIGIEGEPDHKVNKDRYEIVEFC